VCRALAQLQDLLETVMVGTAIAIPAIQPITEIHLRHIPARLHILLEAETQIPQLARRLQAVGW